ncbi:hypothetical protein Cenrod_2510 [Candidatus Symbiobacter mobilis CR]|uniref:Uncharacterized protein n=1 Tax=Candidatus Symbiobacter mobilis CR TaxID=946483 RepID=U5NEI7_9BURK|nr:hypothetical protein Cenrod_2510 [Candidatus Symbiobacter mobilis CR]
MHLPGAPRLQSRLEPISVGRRAEAVCVAPERRNRNVLTVHEDSEHHRRVQCDGAAPTGIGSYLWRFLA